MVAGVDGLRTQLTQQNTILGPHHIDAGRGWCSQVVRSMRQFFGSMRQFFRSMLRDAKRSVPVVLFALASACARGDATESHRPSSLVEGGSTHDSFRTDSLRTDSIARVRQDSVNRTRPGYVIDSILPVEEQLRRFRAAIDGTPVQSLSGGSASRDELVQRFARAVERSDSASLAGLAVSAREFADLIYPESPNVHAPYQQDPALVWRTIQNPSQSGLKRLVRRAGGMAMPVAGYRCNEKPVAVGRNRFWGGCELRIVDVNGATSTHRLFGTIVERGGRFKFMGYRNEF